MAADTATPIENKREYAEKLVADMTVDQLLHQYAIQWKIFDDKGTDQSSLLLDVISTEVKSRMAA